MSFESKPRKDLGYQMIVQSILQTTLYAHMGTEPLYFWRCLKTLYRAIPSKILNDKMKRAKPMDILKQQILKEKDLLRIIEKGVPFLKDRRHHALLSELEDQLGDELLQLYIDFLYEIGWLLQVRTDMVTELPAELIGIDTERTTLTEGKVGED